MSLFDEVVADALRSQPLLAPLRLVVEKELLHHTILRTLNEHGLLRGLTFIGGTCLRDCYGSTRLSEDLDFTGGKDFTRQSMASMSSAIAESIDTVYGFAVKVGEPVKDISNVDTWKIKVETRPGQKHLPAQRINIDICAVPSYEVKAVTLINHYGVNVGTEGLIIQAQSREEIYADKLLAFALRPNRVKYRDVWDIVWLHRSGVLPRFDLVVPKLRDRNRAFDECIHLFEERINMFASDPLCVQEFDAEMGRFLPEQVRGSTFNQEHFWSSVLNLLKDLSSQMRHFSE